MSYEIVNDFPNEIIDLEKGPFISIYQPTHREKPESTQDSIRFKNLATKIENTLKADYKDANIEAIMKPINDIAADNLFWNKSKEGLAVLANEDKCLVYKISYSVEERAIVSDSFHIKPLIRAFQSADRYQVLALNRTSFKLYAGNRYGFDEIEIPEETPTTLEEVLGSELTTPGLGSGRSPLLHGLNSKKEEVEKDTERYFRIVDKFVLDNYSNKTGLPLVLVTLTEHQGTFRKLTHNQHLLDIAVNIDPESVTEDKLDNIIWKDLEPLYLEKTKALVERFENARAKSVGSDDIVEVARASNENKISTVLIESGRIIRGRITEDGKLIEEEKSDNTHEDVLDDIGESVFRNGGEVIVLPKERMPSSTGVAAIFRY